MYKRGLWFVLTLLLLLLLTATVALAAPLQQQPAEGEATSDPLWLAVAPLLAIATAIERLMEQLWERWETSERWPNRAGVSSEKRKASAYVEFKSGWSHWLGFGLAIIAIGFTNVRFFRLLGFDVLFSSSTVLFNLGVGGIFDDFTLGTLVDWLATALIIGWGGTELAHSIVTGLFRGRKLWEEMGEVQKGEKSILDVQFFQDDIAPRLEEMGLSVATLRQAFKALDQVGVSVDQVVGKMTEGTAREFLVGQGEAGEAMLNLLEGDPQVMGYDTVDVGKLLGKLAPDLQKRFLLP